MGNVKKTDYIKSNDRGLNFYNYQTLERFGETELTISQEGESKKEYKVRIQNPSKRKTIFPKY